MLTLEHISYSYSNKGSSAHSFALRDICMTITSGVHACVVGANGSGKTTLVDVMSGRREGFQGRMLLNGIPQNTLYASAVTMHNASSNQRVGAHIAFVHQDATLQFVSTSIRENLAFTLENYGYAPNEIEARIAQVARACGITPFGSIEELSGGETQKLLIAQTLVANPSCIVFDEAFSHLDIETHLELRSLINALVHPLDVGSTASPQQLEQQGILTNIPCIIEVTHNPIDIAFADEVYVLEAGRLVAHTSSTEFLQDRKLMARAGFFAHRSPKITNGIREQKRNILLSVHDVSWAYPANARLVSHTDAKGRPFQNSQVPEGEPCTQKHENLTSLSLDLSSAELCVIAGRSGSGKTSCALNIAGVFSSHTGTITLEGKPVSVGDIGFVHQKTEDMIFAPSVMDEVMVGLIHQGVDEVSARERAERALLRMGIRETLFECNPYELSGGMRRRVGIAAMLALDKCVYIFDEPTSALDGMGRRAVFELIDDMRMRGKAVIVISHDTHAWFDTADYLVLLSNMKCAWRGSPKDVSREDFARAGMEHAFDELSWCAQTDHAQRIDRAQHLNANALPCLSVNHTPCSPLSYGRLPYESKHSVERKRMPIGYAVLLVVGYVITLMSTTNFAILIPCMLGASMLLATRHISWRRARIVLWPITLLSICAFLSNSLCFGNCGGSNVVPFLGAFLRLGGVYTSSVLTVRLVGLSCALIGLVCSYTALEFAHLCTYLMRPLAIFGINITHAELILSITLTSIPRIYQGAQRIITAQRLRGISFSKGKLTQRMNNWMSVLVPLIMMVFREADDRCVYMMEQGFRSN